MTREQRRRYMRDLFEDASMTIQGSDWIHTEGIKSTLIITGAIMDLKDTFKDMIEIIVDLKDVIKDNKVCK